MSRDDHQGRKRLSESRTGSSARGVENVDPQTARPDTLAAIMRDSTIIVDARVYPVAKVYLPQTIRALGPVPPADRGKAAGPKGVERP